MSITPNITTRDMIQQASTATQSKNPHYIEEWLLDMGYKNVPSTWRIGKIVNE